MERLYFLGVDMAKNTFQAALTLDGTNIFETEVENKPKPIVSTPYCLDRILILVV